MEPTQIILKPVITEKSHWENERHNRLTFHVNPRANKHQIKDAVEKLYSVKVTGVATQSRHGKTRRTRFGYVKNGDWKRAVVQLHEDSRIELF